MEEWKSYKLVDFIEFNPTISLKKGTMARKITMDQLTPHSRDIYSWGYEPYSGGAKFQNGDTIMARITPCLENGKHAYISLLDEGETAYGSTEYIVMRSKPGISDNRFVYYLSHYPDFKNAAIKSMVGSSGRQRAQVDVLKNLEFYLPGLEQQKQIADTLSVLDDKIALNNRINHNLEDFLLSLYCRLLDSQCGSSTIGQVSERVYSGGTPDTKNSDYWGGTINWLSSGETSNHFIIDTEKRITENGVLHSSTKFASKYDVVIASAGQGNTRGQTSMTLLDTCINQSVIVIHANTYEAPIVFCSLANRYDELRAISDASSIRGSLTTKMISALEIPVFPEVETFKFASQAKCIIDQVENNLRENRSLTMMRDSLLPKLMRGGLS